jgi:glycosyltransferase involved in cell wall biosynthesis
MRVLLVNESARSHTGGAHRVVVETVGLLAGAGHAVALAYSDGGPSEVPCPLYRFSADQTDSLLAARWAEIVRDFRPDVVQVHLTDHPFFLGEIARFGPVCRYLHDQSFFCSGGDRMLAGFQACHRPHALACFWHHYASRCGGKNPLGNLERWQRVQRNFALGRAMHFQVASEFMAQGLRENQIPPGQIHLVPLFARIPNATAPTVPGRISVASRLVRAKGVHVLVAALQHLPAVTHLVIAGDGPERSRLEQQVQRLGLTARVRFCGEVTSDAVDRELAASEVIVSPTLRPEPFGLVGPEGMSHGKPLVAFDGGATPEWLLDGQTGVLVRERTPAALAAAINSLLSQPKKAAIMAAQGRALWQQKFTPEAYLHALLGSFSQLVAQP